MLCFVLYFQVSRSDLPPELKKCNFNLEPNLGICQDSVFLNAYNKNYHTSFQRVECFPGRNQAAFCELKEGKLPSLKCTSVMLLTYYKTVNLLFTCHLTGAVQRHVKQRPGGTHCSLRGVPGISKTPGKHGAHSLQIYLALQVPKVNHRPLKNTPAICLVAFEFSRYFRFHPKSPMCHTLLVRMRVHQEQVSCAIAGPCQGYILSTPLTDTTRSTTKSKGHGGNNSRQG